MVDVLTKAGIRSQRGAHLAKYKWTKGVSHGPRPPHAAGSGRKQTLMLIDAILAEVGNQQRLKTELKRLFNEDPILFWERFGLPLVPREMVMSISGGEANAVQSMRLVFEVVNQKPGELPAKSQE